MNHQSPPPARTWILPFCAVTLLLASAGCAHTTMRGTVAMKASDDEAHVCLGDHEVKPGDRVSLYQNRCADAQASGAKRRLTSLCRFSKIGEGTVERTFDEHYSLIKVDPGTPFEEGTVVEKN